MAIISRSFGSSRALRSRDVREGMTPFATCTSSMASVSYRILKCLTDMAPEGILFVRICADNLEANLQGRVIRVDDKTKKLETGCLAQSVY